MSEAISEQNLYTEHAHIDYKFIRFADCSIYISDEGYADIQASLKTNKNSDIINISVYLQRYDGDWTTIKEWKRESINAFCFLSEEMQVNSEYDYRIEAYYTARKGAYAETLKTVEKS